MEPNPYEPSATPIAIYSTHVVTRNEAGSDFLRDWEYRRLWFSAILVAITLVMGVVVNLVIFERRFWAMAVQGAFAVNICFCVGPVATWYLSQMGFQKPVVGLFLFWAGTALTMVLTAASIFLTFVPWGVD